MIFRLGLLLSIMSAVISPAGSSQQKEDLKVWKEFIQILRSGPFPSDKIRPIEQLGEEFKPNLVRFLDSIRAHAAPDDWTAEPEAVTGEKRVSYIIPWSGGGRKVDYCFSFVTEAGEWYFQHLEAIFIRLDKLGELPASEFPDITEIQKNWAREEIYWSFIISNLYLPVAKEKGDAHALGMLKDGAGYFVGAKSWIPFVSAHKAFILYLCWEQSRLRGNRVELVRLEEKEAVVKIESHFFAIYTRAAHLKQAISIERYKKIFENIWQDRASEAGWDLEIKYSEDYLVTFLFKRSV